MIDAMNVEIEDIMQEIVDAMDVVANGKCFHVPWIGQFSPTSDISMRHERSDGSDVSETVDITSWRANSAGNQRKINV